MSYDAPVTMVITARGLGKSYGIRKQCIKDYLKKRKRFVEVTRFKEEMIALERNYFDRVSQEFPRYDFKVEKDCAYIAIKMPDPKNQNWELLGYFISMTAFQMIKKMTFNHVKRIILDECIIDRNDRFHDYLPNEWDILTNIVDTVTRERDGDESAHVYLLGNACDVINPYFERARISGTPEHGYSWHAKHTILLHYPDNSDYAREKNATLAGRMALGGDTERTAGENEFVNTELSLCEPKSARAEYVCALVYHDRPLSVWVDDCDGRYYITGQIPRDCRNMYVLTLDDSPNYPLLKKRMPLLMVLGNAYRERLTRFDTPRRHADFREMLQYTSAL